MQLVQLARQNPDTGYWGKARLLIRHYLLVTKNWK